MKLFSRLALALALWALAGCSNLPFLNSSATPKATGTSAPLVVPTQTAVEAGVTPSTLSVWLPQEFDPSADTPASALLAARLQAFETGHPGLNLELRVKSLEGPGGLLESLSAASAAAPLAMPDLVLLPRGDLEKAAEDGLLFGLGDLLSNPSDEDWFDYAVQLGQYNGETYGVAFAGDMLMMAYRPSALEGPPATWEAVLGMDGVLAFPAGDLQAVTTLALYLAEGGAILDEDGDPSLSFAPLAAVLGYYEEAAGAGVMPYWLTQYDTEELSWQAFRESRAQLAITWASRFFQETALTDIALEGIPTSDGEAFSLATGWTWALSGSQSSRHALAVELIEYLTESQFLSDWTLAAGYLPPRPSALASWPRDDAQVIVTRISPAALLIPDAALLDELGEPLSVATIGVLKQEVEAEPAAQTAVDAFGGP